MSVRFETRFTWSINSNKEINIRKTENDLAEDAVFCGLLDDEDILTFGTESVESFAKSRSEYALELINKGEKVEKQFDQ